MANPNIIGLTAIRGKVVGFTIPSNETTLVSNLSSSGQIIKINTVSVANITGQSVDASLMLIKSPQTFSVASAAVVGTVNSGSYTLTIPAYVGPFLSTSTNISGTTTGTGLVVGTISLSNFSSPYYYPSSNVYSVSISGATGAVAGTQTSFSWTNPSVSLRIAASISVPALSSLVLISKDSGIYLEEGDYLSVYASSSSSMTVFCSYEVLG